MKQPKTKIILKTPKTNKIKSTKIQQQDRWISLGPWYLSSPTKKAFAAELAPSAVLEVAFLTFRWEAWKIAERFKTLKT